MPVSFKPEFVELEGSGKVLSTILCETNVGSYFRVRFDSDELSIRRSVSAVRGAHGRGAARESVSAAYVRYISRPKSRVLILVTHRIHSPELFVLVGTADAAAETLASKLDAIHFTATTRKRPMKPPHIQGAWTRLLSGAASTSLLQGNPPSRPTPAFLLCVPFRACQLVLHVANDYLIIMLSGL